MERIGTGNAKLLLFGEHSAVYGFPSLGLGLPASTRIEVRGEAEEEGWRFPGLPKEDWIHFNEFIDSVARIVPRMRREGGTIRVSSTIPRGLGFGSSAALCVGLAKAFAPDGASTADIWSIAHRAEGFFHGTPSGIDTGLSLLGDLRSFRPSPPALPETRTLHAIPLHLVIGAVSRRASTAAHVATLSSKLASGDTAAVKLVEELGEIAERALDCFEGNDRDYSMAPFRLGPLFEAAHSTLRGLGFGDPRIDRLLNGGIEFGALGGKQSGAGGGGAFFLVYPSSESAQAAADALAELARREGLPLAAQPRAFSPSL